METRLIQIVTSSKSGITCIIFGTSTSRKQCNHQSLPLVESTDGGKTFAICARTWRQSHQALDQSRSSSIHGQCKWWWSKFVTIRRAKIVDRTISLRLSLSREMQSNSLTASMVWSSRTKSSVPLGLSKVWPESDAEEFYPVGVASLGLFPFVSWKSIFIYSGSTKESIHEWNASTQTGKRCDGLSGCQGVAFQSSDVKYRFQLECANQLSIHDRQRDLIKCWKCVLKTTIEALGGRISPDLTKNDTTIWIAGVNRYQWGAAVRVFHTIFTWRISFYPCIVWGADLMGCFIVIRRRESWDEYSHSNNLMRMSQPNWGFSHDSATV